MSAEAVIDTIATSVGALGTAGALIVAAAAYRRQTLDRHREQASKIGAWIEREYASAWGQPQAKLKAQHLRVRNASDQPIFQVVATISDGSGELRAIQAQQFTTLPPGADESTSLTEAAQLVGVIEPPLHLTLTFVDSAGSTWQRDSRSGHLTEIKRAAARAGLIAAARAK